MFGGKRTGKGIAWAGALALLAAVSVRAEVNLEWRPVVVGASVNDIVEVGLYAVSDSGFDQSFSGISALFSWNPKQLALLDFVEPCTQEPCPVGTYGWIQSWFPDDSQLDGINDDLTDGDAFFQVLGQLGIEHLPFATMSGLHVTTLRFQVLAQGATEIAFEAEIGDTRTRVAGGDLPGLEITGTLSPPVQVVVRDCDVPTVAATGGRYLSVTPASGADALALLVTGDALEPEVSCLSLYVQPDGSLAAEPVYQLPEAWETVHIYDEGIRPQSSYSVQADCAMEATGLILSEASSATTWRWGDTNGDDLVGFADVSRVIDSADGSLPAGVLLDAVDLAPCIVDGVVNQNDVDAAAAALGLHPFPCAPICVLTSLPDLPAFVDCLGGPFVMGGEPCEMDDFDEDGDVDLEDFQTFQRRFVGGQN